VHLFLHAGDEAKGRPGRRLTKTILRVVTFAPVLFIVLGAGALLLAQSPAPAAQGAARASLDASRIIPFLDQTLTWFRQMMVDQQVADDPSEVTIVSDNRQLANQIVRLSFDFARAEADALASKPASSRVQEQNAGTPQQQAILKAEDEANQQIQKAESQLDSLRQKLTTATGGQRQALQAQIVDAQGQLDLEKARRDAIHNMVEFVAGAGSGEAGGLRGQIDALAASVPTIAAASSPGGNQANTKDQANAAQEAAAGEPTGIWGLGAQIFGISHKLSTINGAMTQTQTLANASNDLLTPLANRLRALTKQADAFDNQSKDANAPPSGDKSAPTLTQRRQQVDAMTAEFKQLAAIAIPLGKQKILFGLYEKSLENWHDEVRGDLKGLFERLLTRLLVLAIFIGIVLLFGEIGKRTIYRYVHEPHRRYQFLLLRKIAMAFAITIIVALGLASRLDSAVTYAGLLTAGIAVALQNVIVAVVGYFFLIGRYGIRVGDRVQISGVTGEVVDIGLVRMQVMELGGSAADTPTGRVVAISNSVVFQPTAGIFRQIPGTDFLWHEVSLTFAPDSDFKAVRERLLQAVDGVLADYREELERQNRAMERNLLGVPQGGLKPSAHLRLTPSGLEAMVRFPVDLHHAGEIDERITRELLKAVDQEPRLKLAGSAPISLRTAAGAA
jgi:small-conductance mechanosensitive channel